MQQLKVPGFALAVALSALVGGAARADQAPFGAPAAGAEMPPPPAAAAQPSEEDLSPPIDVQTAAAPAAVVAQAAPPPQAAPAPAPPAEDNPIPPYVEGQAVATQPGSYCFGGPHPAPGGGWEASQAPHMHNYAPFDLRLFAFRSGCYYFIGDPRDFGYNGQTYSYYGAHPILDAYGGGWCFMIGPHSHWWRPWSPYFTVVGPWNYWYGPYDPFFWAYWPYYSFYYRAYYPSYYAGGRFYSTWRSAPPITRVPTTGWRGSAPGTAAVGAGTGWRGTPPVTTSPLRGGGAYATPQAGSGWRGAPPAGAAARPPMGGALPYRGPAPSGGGWRPAPVPSFSAPLRGAPSGGGFRPPSGGGFHGGGGGGWRGGFHGGRR